MQKKKKVMTGIVILFLLFVSVYMNIFNKSKGIFPFNTIHYLIMHKKIKLKNDTKSIDQSNNEDDVIHYVDLYNVIIDDTPNTFDTYGTIIGKQEQAIIFDNTGKIAYISENRQVKKGDVYISLDTTQLDLKKKSLMAQLSTKSVYLKSLQELHKSGLASTMQIEETKTKITELEFQIKEMDVHISNMILKAPNDGYFFIKNTASSVGAIVHGRQEIGYFFSNMKQIKFFIPHDLLIKLKENEEIKVLFFPDSDNTSKQIEGVLKFNFSFVRPMTNSENEHNNSLCEAKADLINSEDILPMFYNQNGKIRVIFNEKSQNCLIPEVAVTHRGVKSFIYIVQDDRVILTEIFPISTGNGYIRVNQPNITSGTTIVLNGLNKLHHMAKINVNNNLSKTNIDTKKEK